MDVVASGAKVVYRDGCTKCISGKPCCKHKGGWLGLFFKHWLVGWLKTKLPPYPQPERLAGEPNIAAGGLQGAERNEVVGKAKHP